MTNARVRQLSFAFGVSALIITAGFILGDLIGRASAHGMVLGAILAIAVAPWSMMVVVRR